MPLTLTHMHGRHVRLHYQGNLLFAYPYGMHTYPPTEFHRPYLHPVNTVAGDTVTLARPADAPYQRGVSLSLGTINGQNFWGGPTNGDTNSAVASLENIGRAEHVAWEVLETAKRPRRADENPDETTPIETARLHQRLHWQTAQGNTWLREDRKLHLEAVDERAGYWSLRISSRLVNVAGQPLTLTEPKMEQASGLSGPGWGWRGVRALEGGTVFTAEGASGTEVDGSRAAWCAWAGTHDTVLRGSTVIMQDNPQNPRAPSQWALAGGGAAGGGIALCRETPYIVQPGEVLHLRCRIVLADGTWTQTPVESLLRHMPLITDTNYERS